ncbi:MAG: repressor LexA [Gammaproteobacteria bacterium RIFCSPHIGHO2_12_FULL_41_15]|nr:MAG: repressor LexA [Gammaproteobacteria bacterium RIFCSPHIGHO2_12_FULL_41_15]
MRENIPLSLRRTYIFIKDFINKQEYAPTAAEIAKGIGIRSRGVVYRNLKGLETVGLITLLPRRHRNIRLTGKSLTQLRAGLPLIGKIAAGSPIELIENQETLDVVNLCLGPNRFSLKVIGHSMMDEGIQDGDYIICESVDHIKNGDIVVALIDNEKATLKKLQPNDGDTITLLSINSQHEPQVYPVHRVQLQGLYIGLLRIA